MDKIRKTFSLIASTQNPCSRHLPFLPFLSLASSIYKVSLFLLHKLYLYNLFQKHRLPVPVVSVGNLTWGGNGKTPMTEFIARVMDEAGISPLILTRGYAGGDEAKMLHRHLSQTSVRVGVGANRRAIGSLVIEQVGHMDHSFIFEMLSSSSNFQPGQENKKVGVVILDDGMQHLSLHRNVDLVMVNSLMPWGNNHLLPRGSLREPLTALGRTDIIVLHHADLVPYAQLKVIESTVRKETASALIYFTRLAPLYFFEVNDTDSKLPLSILYNTVVLCVTGIGCADAFVFTISQIGPSHIDRLDFGDHHQFQSADLYMIRDRVHKLQNRLKSKVAVVMTEKDFDRDPLILRELDDLTLLVLCSSIQFFPAESRTEEDFKTMLKSLLIQRMSEI